MLEPIANRGVGIDQLGVAPTVASCFSTNERFGFSTRANGATVCALNNLAGANPCSTLALFPPEWLDDADGGDAIAFNLWKTPTQAERGYELRELVTKDRVSITSGAFAGGNLCFVITGSKEGFVHVWPMPQQAEANGHLIFSDASNKELRLDLVEQGSSAGKTRIAINFDNPQLSSGHSCWSRGSGLGMIRWNKE